MNGQLFTQDFLTRGIVETPVWKALNDSVIDAFGAALTKIIAPFDVDSRPNEAITESQVIIKVLGQLGWDDLVLPQVTTSGARREDVPDLLMFPDSAAKAAALKERQDYRRYTHAIAILESKRWMRTLDRGDSMDRFDAGTPSNQILRYLSAAETASDRAVRWGVLTNGAVWRLYYQGARSRSEDFIEIDLAAVLALPGTLAPPSHEGLAANHVLKVFFILFHREAFLSQGWDELGRTFHLYALAEARQYEQRVSQNLGARVFNRVFPELASALAAHDPRAAHPYSHEYLEEVREASLILLYRILFVLYAEDRELLPVRDKRYTSYSLRRLREEVRDKSDKGAAFAATSARIWDALKDLFGAIANGDRNLGLPAYNGGLFDDVSNPILARARVADAALAPVIDELSRAETQGAWINYRDLSVQHLGSIYERLLEYRLVEDGDHLAAQPTSFARKGSGSYYTHDDLVKLLIGEAIGPLIAERVDSFDSLVESWKKKPILKLSEWNQLDAADPASRILELKVCDPAMGSGHFLVALVDDLADRILESISHATELVGTQRWAEGIANPWTSPLATRIADVRARILAAGLAQGWTIDANQLDDRHVVRRMILKRVIHGVDKNPMAVELAKVALWLHTFTVGAPLSFLDHHLRCGDALFGGWVPDLKKELGKLAGGLLQQDDLHKVDAARMTMQAIGDLTDIDIAETHQSKAMMDQIEDSLRPLKRGLDFLQAKRWAGRAEREEYDETWADLLSQEFGEDLLDSLELLSRRGIRLHGEHQKRAHRIVQSALARAGEVRFLHWELAFPTVWMASGEGGFDAVIGNPPWDRMKLQEVEWFAERRPEIALAVRASDRRKLIQNLRKNSDPLWDEYLSAQEVAETAVAVARTCGDFPLLSNGDVNLYSLFVERADQLLQPKGIVGLLTPSGISADKGAAEFFRGISGTGRLASLFDFENKKVFFPDIDTRFKFSALVFGGRARTFPRARCAFYLHSLDELRDADRILTLGPEDFLSVNPNTGSAPVFRTKRDAEITTAAYRRCPVLVDRSTETKKNPAKCIWPVRYVRMFDMTNDSGLFRRRDELENQGWYRVEGNHFRKGDAEAVPLYEGKMVQLYDHRAADIVMNVKNLKRPAQQEATSLEQHQDPKFSPTPQFWVYVSDIEEELRQEWMLGFKHVTAPTNVRTMIAAIVPACGAGNSLPLFLRQPGLSNREYASAAAMLLANFNSFAFDFLLRQKVQGQNLNLYIIEQMPVIRAKQFEGAIGKSRIADFVRNEVLHLTYTALDMQSFARDLGFDGQPFAWDPEDRRHRMARLDALFFYLYGIGRDDASYILDTFPIVREEDERVFERFRTKDLVLAYLNAVTAGDLVTRVSL